MLGICIVHSRYYRLLAPRLMFFSRKTQFRAVKNFTGSVLFCSMIVFITENIPVFLFMIQEMITNIVKCIYNNTYFMSKKTEFSILLVARESN